MKYDIIVVGGGPGGLMSAKTAAEDGLKTLLIERAKGQSVLRAYGRYHDRDSAG